MVDRSLHTTTKTLEAKIADGVLGEEILFLIVFLTVS